MKKITIPVVATVFTLIAAVSLSGCSSDTQTPKPTPTASTSTVVDGAEDFPKAIDASIAKSLSTGLTVVGTDGLDNTIESAFDPARPAGKNVVLHTSSPENLFYPDAGVYGDGKNGVLVLGDMKSVVDTLKSKIEFDTVAKQFSFTSNDGKISYKISVKDNLISAVDALILGEKNTARALHFDIAYSLTTEGKALFK